MENPTVNINVTSVSGESRFDGGLLQLVGWAADHGLYAGHLPAVGLLHGLPLGGEAHGHQRPPAGLRRHGDAVVREMASLAAAHHRHGGHLQLLGEYQAEKVESAAYAVCGLNAVS